MTHHGSFPGRPRGRRARPDNDVPEWAGYDAVPQDQRELPDLTPIRDQDARTRDGRVQGGYAQGGQGGQGGQSAPGGPGHAPGHAPWENQPWPPQQGPGQGAGQGPGQPSAPPWATQPQASAQPPASAQPQALGRSHRQSRQGRSGWADSADADADPMEAFSERWRRRGSDSREDRRADRRKRRRQLIAGGGVVAVAIAVAVYFFTGNNGSSANLGLNNLVTTFLPGELQQVPDACTSVPQATLGQYLPGQLKMASPPLNTGATSQCTWTLDKPPMYRVLEVNMQAYSPSGLASGDGSATFAAEDAYAEFETAKQNPGPHSGQPPASVTDLSSLPGGNDTVAFEAAQVFNVNGATTDVSTMIVRYRNVIVTVVLNGLDHANTGNYGPVSPDALNSAAQTVARQVTSELVH